MYLPGGGHDTRSVVFSKDGKHVFVGVGSESNVSPGEEPIRAAVTICDPDGKNARLFATGLRTPVGLAIEPKTGELWTTVNERDELGDDLPPDYFTSVRDGGFYGWPYSYIGDNVDPLAHTAFCHLQQATIPASYVEERVVGREFQRLEDS